MGQKQTRGPLACDDASPIVDLPLLVTKQFAKAPFAAVRPSAGFIQKRKHGIAPPLVAR
jgi:hypothetical protein